MSEHHGHSHGQGETSKEENLALLKYTAEHNAHHGKELHELAHGVSGKAETVIHEAVKRLEESTQLLQKAIKLLEE